jgi:hypothetical protein
MYSVFRGLLSFLSEIKDLVVNIEVQTNALESKATLFAAQRSRCEHKVQITHSRAKLLCLRHNAFKS